LVELQDYYWPDTDNTALAFEYGADGTVAPSSGLPAEAQERARRTLGLTGLDKHPLGDRQASPDDYRWFDRLEAWDQATHYLQAFEQNQTRPETVAGVMKERGMWSVWMTVFGAYTEVRRALISELPGTATDCFDPHTCEPIPRPGGDL